MADVQHRVNDLENELKVLKNRNGLVNQVATLNYNGATQRITGAEW